VALNWHVLHLHLDHRHRTVTSQANPQTFSLQVSWYQNSFPIQTTDRRTMNTRANRHTLTIRHIQQEDFGNYRWVELWSWESAGLESTGTTCGLQWTLLASVDLVNLATLATTYFTFCQPVSSSKLPLVWVCSRGTRLSICYILHGSTVVLWCSGTVVHPRPALGNCLCWAGRVEAWPTHFADKQVFHINVNLSETY